MAKKKNKNRKGGAAGGRTAAGLFASDFAGEVLGNVVGILLANGLQNYLPGARGKPQDKGHRDQLADDVAARLLKALAERGPLSIADLMAATGVGLSPTLGALQTVRDFRLVEFVGGDAEGDGNCLVQLTRNGSQTVTVIQKNGMRREAARLLED